MKPHAISAQAIRSALSSVPRSLLLTRRQCAAAAFTNWPGADLRGLLALADRRAPAVIERALLKRASIESVLSTIARTLYASATFPTTSHTYAARRQLSIWATRLLVQRTTELDALARNLHTLTTTWQ